MNSVRDHVAWRKTKLPVNISNPIENILREGIMYQFGRDHRFRPILVINPYKIDVSKVDTEIFMDAMTYFLEFILKNMFLPGQVENWVIIIDLNNMSFLSMPINLMKQIFGYLQNNYRSRLFRMYVMNTPFSIYVPWSIAKSFLEENTVKKINFIKSPKAPQMWEHINPDQVEEKFDGKAPNLTTFWPPKPVSPNYLTPKDDPATMFITEEKYIQLLRSGAIEKNHKSPHIKLPEDAPKVQESEVPAQKKVEEPKEEVKQGETKTETKQEAPKQEAPVKVEETKEQTEVKKVQQPKTEEKPEQVAEADENKQRIDKLEHKLEEKKEELSLPTKEPEVSKVEQNQPEQPDQPAQQQPQEGENPPVVIEGGENQALNVQEEGQPKESKE
eukprot:TRINITY_DN3329_c0_g1_i8.p1 TRINITY_DN3329_c0_g1~~TRINITY_DN3329_c0_g1_i8.p1  ORF type:complete len:387 (+),score=132.01 TRINITY_DN3329_c0_g1_i8:127-1287(+)